MSKFGNNALIWWDYHKRDRADLLRFNSTPKELQLQILKKWYPIGMMCGLIEDHQLYQYEIVEYVEHLSYWSVRVIFKIEGSIMINMRSNRNPLALYPSPTWEQQIKREYKINRII